MENFFCIFDKKLGLFLLGVEAENGIRQEVCKAMPNGTSGIDASATVPRWNLWFLMEEILIKHFDIFLMDPPLSQSRCNYIKFSIRNTVYFFSLSFIKTLILAYKS